MAFGSWWLTAGTRHKRVRVAWDGKDFRLSCATSPFTNSSAPAKWIEVESVDMGDQSDDQAVFAMVGELVLRHLGVAQQHGGA